MPTILCRDVAQKVKLNMKQWCLELEVVGLVSMVLCEIFELNLEFAKIRTADLAAISHGSFMIMPRVAPNYGNLNTTKRM